MWPIHRRPDGRGNRPGDLRADRIDLFAVGGRQRRGLAPQPGKFGTAYFVESVVERTRDGTHARLKGKRDAATDLLEMRQKAKESRIAEAPAAGYPARTQEPDP